MNDDELIAALLEDTCTCPAHVAAAAADRIEELRAGLRNAGRELNLARYGQADFAWPIHKAAMADIKSKLSVATAALHEIAGKKDYADDPWSIARAALKELNDHAD